jgi:uncharacterized protein YndB with AHSA1/START domain
MSNTINQNSIIIKSPPDRVWKTLTADEGITNCLPSIKVASDWKIGSKVEYACYNPDGSIMIWNDQEMIWRGIIAVLETNKVYTVEYNGSNGLIKETYSLETDNDNVKLTFTQECVDEASANGYKDGNQFTLQAIKEYLEK